MSDEKIGAEIELQKLARGFTGTEVIPLNQIRPKVSMFMYTTDEQKWHWQRWNKIFDEERCNHFVNEQEKILIITELSVSNVDWTLCRDISNDNWNLHVLYSNEEKGAFFINTTDKTIADRLAEEIFDNCKRVRGENVFRCLYGINRLMLSTVGLKTAISTHHIRYRMFAGIDIAEGISGATNSSAIKSNLFGVGYENGHSISIGCSYKGTIWAKWVETIDYWRKWCNKQAEKILNPSIDTSTVLRGALVPEEIHVRPAVVPYRIDFPEQIDADFAGSIVVKTALAESKSFLIEIGLLSFDETSELSFFVGNDTFKEEFALNITATGYLISHKKGSVISIRLGRGREISLKEFFQDNPPTVWFVDGSSLEGNLLVKLENACTCVFPTASIISWKWHGVDICKESQGASRATDSIQYRLISELKATGKYCLV